MKYDPSLPEDGVNVSPTHPLAEAALLVGGVLLAGALLVTAFGLAANLLVPHLPVSLEARLFAWVGADAPGEEEDARAEALRGLLSRMAAHWNENPYALRVAVWDEEQPNALAFPGGLVVVTTGLLDGVESENELAFVLGHELGHFRNRDHLRGLSRGLALALALSVISATGAGGAAELTSLAGDLTRRSFDREQERSADRFGLELLVAEYGHVANAWDFFESLPEPEGALEEQLAHYLSTHPLSTERVEALHALAAERGWPEQGAVEPFAVE